MKDSIISAYDENEDRKYFTIIPNFILNHSTAIDQSLYIQIKKHAGEKGECYVSEKTLMKKLSIGRKALKKSLEYLHNQQWIMLTGVKSIKTKGGDQKVKSYKVVDIWGANLEFYEGVSKSTPHNQRGVPKNTQGVVESNQRGVLLADKEEPYNKIPSNKNQDTAEQAPQDIISLIESFSKNINPACKKMYGNTTQRKACRFLIDTYTLERVLIIIEKTLPRTNKITYCPTITTPLQLQDKWSSLEASIIKLKNKPEKKVLIIK